MDKQTLEMLDALQTLLGGLSQRIEMMEDSIDSLREQIVEVEETLRQNGLDSQRED